MVDYFGPPSEEEAAQGLSTHGEAPSLKWRKSSARLTARPVKLDAFRSLARGRSAIQPRNWDAGGESVVYLKETVTNERKLDHFFHWTQHATLAPPFVAPEDGRVFMSATKGITSPDGYGGKALLESGKEFQWPLAPASTGGEVDLSHCLIRKGLGIIASLLLDPARDVQFVGGPEYSAPPSVRLLLPPRGLSLGHDLGGKLRARKCPMEWPRADTRFGVWLRTFAGNASGGVHPRSDFWNADFFHGARSRPIDDSVCCLPCSLA